MKFTEALTAVILLLFVTVMGFSFLNFLVELMTDVLVSIVRVLQ